MKCGIGRVESEANTLVLFRRIVEEQKRFVRAGYVFWGYNAAGELAPFPKEAILGV